MFKLLQDNVILIINTLTGRVARLEENMLKLQEKLDESLAIQRNHLVRLKNNEEVSDSFLSTGHSYADLSPEKAYRIYSDENKDFILLDVSHRDYQAPCHLAEAIKISLEELDVRYKELIQKNTPILIISEEGLRSILACEFLSQKGYYNTNNISGGYRYWPDTAKQEEFDESSDIESA